MSAAVIISAVIGICFGGLAGALLTNFFTYYRARTQSVGYSVEVVTVAPQLEKWRFHAQISIQNRDGLLVGVDRLDLVWLEVVNQGNRDLEKFSFGVSLPPRTVVLDTKMITRDRHHTIEQNQRVISPDSGEPDTKVILGSMGNMASPDHVISDFTVYPFNRKDTYAVQLVTTPNRGIPGTGSYMYPATDLSADNISVSTAEVGVVLKEMPQYNTAQIESIIMPIVQRTSALVAIFAIAIAVATNLFNGTPYLIPASLLLVVSVFLASLLVVAIPINKRINTMKRKT